MNQVSKRIIIFISEVFTPIPSQRGDWNGSQNLCQTMKQFMQFLFEPLQTCCKETMLRILASYEAKTAKISNYWTFWPASQLINHFFKIEQKTFCSTLHRSVWVMSLYFLHLWTVGEKVFSSDFEKMAYELNYRPECPEVDDFCCFCLITKKYP